MAKRKPAVIASDKGLHEIQQPVSQLSFMESHCESIGNNLDVLIKVTYDKAPLQRAGKKQTYELSRKPKPDIDESEEERLVEQAIWRQFSPPDGPVFLKNDCPRVVAYQTPLKNSAKDTSWGMVDLLGASPQGLPVVIELKKKGAADTPLRMLVEALAYALAVQKSWNQGTKLRGEWAARMSEFGPVQKNDTALLSVPIILLAPAAFWEKKTGTNSGRIEGQVFTKAWKPFHLLMDKCKERGFPVHCVQFEEVGKPASPDFHVKDVSHVELP
jgi:hypothetical protein